MHPWLIRIVCHPVVLVEEAVMLCHQHGILDSQSSVANSLLAKRHCIWAMEIPRTPAPCAVGSVGHGMRTR